MCYLRFHVVALKDCLDRQVSEPGVFCKVLLRSEFVLQHFGEITHVLTRGRLRGRQRQETVIYAPSIAACVSGCVETFSFSVMQSCGEDKVFGSSLNKGFAPAKDFLPCMQHNKLPKQPDLMGGGASAEFTQSHTDKPRPLAR